MSLAPHCSPRHAAPVPTIALAMAAPQPRAGGAGAAARLARAARQRPALPRHVPARLAAAPARSRSAITRPGAAAGAAPAADFDGAAALRPRDATSRRSSRDRAPGSAGLAARPRSGSATRCARTTCRSRPTPGREDVPGLGRVGCRTCGRSSAGQSPGRDRRDGAPRRHRRRPGRERQRERHGGAARARARLRAAADARGRRAVRSAHTLVFLSTDGGAFGGLGALRFAERAARGRVVAVVNLDAIAGAGPPRIEIAGDTPRSPAAALVETAARAVARADRLAAGARAGFGAQLVDLALPVHALRAGPVRRARHPRDHADDGRRAARRTRSRHRARGSSHGRLGADRAARRRSCVGSLDQGLELAQGTTSYVWVGDRIDPRLGDRAAS